MKIKANFVKTIKTDMKKWGQSVMLSKEKFYADLFNRKKRKSKYPITIEIELCKKCLQRFKEKMIME